MHSRGRAGELVAIVDAELVGGGTDHAVVQIPTVIVGVIVIDAAA